MATEQTVEKKLIIFYDDVHTEAEAQLLPRELREDYIWLKQHVNFDCKRDVDVLVTEARALGITIDKTNWVRILKGRWKHDADGNELATPYISAPNLARAIKSLREKIRVELLQGRTPFVETTIFHTLRRFIEKKMRPDRVNRFGIILGPTGTQKTACFKELARRNTSIKWLEAPDNGSIKEFTIGLAVKYGASRNISYTQARSKIEESFGPDKCLIIDNTQDMVRSDKMLAAMGKSVEKQPIYQFLRRLQDEKGGTVIESITPESEEMMFDGKSVYLEQFEGRAGGRNGFLRLPNKNPKKDLVQIALALGFTEAEKHADLLSAIDAMRGRIRTFFEVMQDAKDAADDAEEKLTIEHIEEAMSERVQAEPALRKEKV